MKNFSKNILFLREYKGMKQVEISDKLGIKLSTWNNYEKGVSNPGIEGLTHISNFFGVSETALLHSDLVHAHNQGELTFNEDRFILNPHPRFVFSHEKDVFIAANPLPINKNQEKEKEEVTAALREVIEMQKALIHSLNNVIDMLRDELAVHKKK